MPIYSFGILLFNWKLTFEIAGKKERDSSIHHEVVYAQKKVLSIYLSNKPVNFRISSYYLRMRLQRIEWVKFIKYTNYIEIVSIHVNTQHIVMDDTNKSYKNNCICLDTSILSIMCVYWNSCWAGVYWRKIYK